MTLDSLHFVSKRLASVAAALLCLAASQLASRVLAAPAPQAGLAASTEVRVAIGR